MLRTELKFLYRLARESGIDARRWSLLARLPRFVRDLRAWRAAGGPAGTLYPCLADWSDSAGATGSPYFLQDLLVARRIHAAAPRRHIDVGSRIDGFVAHLAVFREVTVLDVRPMTSSIPNVTFAQCDLMRGPAAELIGSADSVSSLHALEHFGLGRYGDPIDPQGHLRGFRALASMLQVGGRMYMSVPVGSPTVEFNAHRIFDPSEPPTWPEPRTLALAGFDFIDDCGALHEHQSLDDLTCASIRRMRQACGIYTFDRL